MGLDALTSRPQLCNCIHTKKRKLAMKNTEDGSRSGPSDLPFPRKVAAIIRDMPLKLVQEKPPHELTQTLKKTFREVGDDFLV
jgi:hypothetical protein